ncbi:hypothetical protein K504DRAFT_345443, partial [Pleomassaria siparia CBS 279.74]
MADFQAYVGPYDLAIACARDKNKYHCIFIDVGRHVPSYSGPESTSLQNLSFLLNRKILPDKKRVASTTMLYVIGEWKVSDPSTTVDKPEKLDHGDDELTTNKGRTVSRQEVEWDGGIERICKLIEKLPNLKELTWISSLPFTEAVWSALPSTTLSTLVIDVGAPVHLDSNYSNRPTYISQESMKPLVNFRNLKELRIFNIHNSLQSIIWETVYRNTSDNKGMSVLDLSMASGPFVRDQPWNKAKDVMGLNVTISKKEEYLGVPNGGGVLHHEHGTGEYLDRLCMMKARKTSYTNTCRELRLCSLKLDGFVVDHLPFEYELSRIVLLTCGENCVDAGLRAPKSVDPQDNWGFFGHDRVSQCLIAFPHWLGIFDAEGKEKSNHGTRVSQRHVHISRPAPNATAPRPPSLSSSLVLL